MFESNSEREVIFGNVLSITRGISLLNHHQMRDVYHKQRPQIAKSSLPTRLLLPSPSKYPQPPTPHAPILPSKNSAAGPAASSAYEKCAAVMPRVPVHTISPTAQKTFRSSAGYDGIPPRFWAFLV